MSALTDVQSLKQQAIDLLLNEREQIDAELTQLGYGQENAAPHKKRGPKPKIIPVAVPPPPVSHSETKAPGETSPHSVSSSSSQRPSLSPAV